MAHMWTQMDLLTKHLLGGSLEKVKAAEATVKYHDPDIDYDYNTQ